MLKQANEHQDILAALLAARDSETGDAFGADELVDHVSILFLAGHETSATALTWACLLGRDQDYQQQVYDEIQQVVGQDEVGFNHIAKLKSCLDLFRETLRLYPPVGFFMRQAVEQEQLRDKTVPAGLR